MTGPHAAKQWVEENFPSAAGLDKAALILAYGAGLGAGLAEAQEICEAAAAVFPGAAAATNPHTEG